MKTIPCIAANSSGFVTMPATVFEVISAARAPYQRACRAYTAANDLGVRPAIQQCVTLMRLINILEDFDERMD